MRFCSRVNSLQARPVLFQPLAPPSKLGTGSPFGPLACDVNITSRQRRPICHTAASTFVYRLVRASCEKGEPECLSAATAILETPCKAAFVHFQPLQKPSRFRLARRLVLICVSIGRRIPLLSSSDWLLCIGLPAPRSRVGLAPPLAVAQVKGCDWLLF